MIFYNKFIFLYPSIVEMHCFSIIIILFQFQFFFLIVKSYKFIRIHLLYTCDKDFMSDFIIFQSAFAFIFFIHWFFTNTLYSPDSVIKVSIVVSISLILIGT